MAIYSEEKIRTYVDAGWWGTQTLVELLDQRVRSGPSRVALVDAPDRDAWLPGTPRRLSWQELAELVQGVADQLVESGVRPGERVGIQLPNVSELVVALLAVLHCDAVAVPFPVQHRAHEITTGWDAASLRCFLTAARPDRSDHLATIGRIAADRGGQTLALSTGRELPGQVELHRSRWSGDLIGTDPDAVATICWTSGTTGTPKGVPRTHNAWVAAGQFNVVGVGLSAADVVLCPFPLVNMAGIGGMLVPWLLAGFQLVLHQPFDLATFLAQIAAERVSYTVAPPPLLNMLLRSGELLERSDLSSVRAIGSGAAPLDPAMVEGWQAAHGIDVINIFGSNEGAALIATRDLVDDPVARARMFPAIGRSDASWDTPVAHLNETRLVDLDSGAEIATPDRPGELRFRGPTVFGGYLDSDGTEFDEAGFFRTGDLFHLESDDRGRLYYRFVDRVKDIIIRGGMNISATEVETLLSSHPGVREVSVVAAPGGDLGELVAAVVVAEHDPPELDDLVSHLRALGVASYKLPEHLAVVPELPRNPLGKVVKDQLRALFS